MSDQSFVINISEEDVVLRVAQTSFGQINVVQASFGHIRVAKTSFGQVKVMGGVPGPPGADGESDSGLMALHILDPTPHPPYDDQPSLTLIFENGLV